MGTPARVVVLPADNAKLRVESLELLIGPASGSGQTVCFGHLSLPAASNACTPQKPGCPRA